MISRIIHYCWFGGKPLDSVSKKCIESWRKNCPGYEIKEWNEQNFNIDFCEYSREAYDNKKWAFVSDVARLWVLFHFGGIYLDTDVEVIKPFDDLLNLNAFFGFQNMSQVSAGTIATEAKNPLIADFLGIYEKLHFINGDRMDLTPNVDRITDVCIKHGLILNNQKQIVCDAVVLPSEYFFPKSLTTGKMHLTANTYAIHHFNASWADPTDKFRGKVFRGLCNLFGEKFASKIRKKIGRNTEPQHDGKEGNDFEGT